MPFEIICNARRRDGAEKAILPASEVEETPSDVLDSLVTSSLRLDSFSLDRSRNTWSLPSGPRTMVADTEIRSAGSICLARKVNAPEYP